MLVVLVRCPAQSHSSNLIPTLVLSSQDHVQKTQANLDLFNRTAFDRWTDQSGITYLKTEHSPASKRDIPEPGWLDVSRCRALQLCLLECIGCRRVTPQPTTHSEIVHFEMYLPSVSIC